MNIEIIDNTTPISGPALLAPVEKSFNSGGSFVILPNYPILSNGISGSGAVIAAGNTDVILTVPPPTFLGSRKIFSQANITYKITEIDPALNIRVRIAIKINGVELCYVQHDVTEATDGDERFSMATAYLLDPSVAGLGSVTLELQNLCGTADVTIVTSYLTFMEF